jgi:hypothetical protein
VDWSAAIEKNREALKRILAALVAMDGLADDRPGTLPRHLHRAVLRLLRPAEAATRRLVIVAARGFGGYLAAAALALTETDADYPAQRRRHRHCDAAWRCWTPPACPLGFQLLDPLPRWESRPRRVAARSVPRISVPGYSTPFPIPPPPSPDDPVDAARLGRRFAALALALDDLPAHARRFARWRARGADAIVAQNKNRDAAAQTGETRHLPYRRARPRRIWPLRPGRPPGWRRRPEYEVHEVLNVTHGLAFDVLERRDTS